MLVIGMNSSYLNDREAQDWSRNITDPHASKCCNKHVGDKYSSRSRPSLAQNKGCDSLCNVIFGKGSSDSKASEEEHNHRLPHRGKYICCCVACAHPTMGGLVTNNSQNDTKERNYKCCDE